MKNKIDTNVSDKWILIIGIPLVSGIAYLVYYLAGGTYFQSQIYNFLMGLGSTIIIWLGCRAIIKYLWKKYPWNKYPVKHLLIEIFAITAYLTAYGLISYNLNLMALGENSADENLTFSIAFSFLITFLIVAIHEGWFLFLQWKASLVKSEKLERENMQARFETLKNQVNPHFLFNSLNTLMTYIDDNPKASEFVNNLSDFFRSVLTTRDEEVVELNEEIKILKRYVFIQSSRFGNSLKVHFNIDQDPYRKSFIPPLTLQMLVENAIKHNVISKDNPLFIDIYFEDEYIVVKNNLQRKRNPSSTGIGLSNIKKRYQYLTNKKVKIIETENVFLISVPLLNLNK